MKQCLGLVAACLVISACGSSVQVIPSPPRILNIPPPSPMALHFSADSNRAFARRDVQQLIRNVVLPRSARRVPSVPKSAPRWFRNELSDDPPGAAVAHRTWVVDAPVKNVVRYLRAHARLRPRPVTSVHISENRIGSLPHDDWWFEPVPGRSSNRWLYVLMERLRSGATVVTAQAGDEWVHPPPASAELPGTVRRIGITSRYQTNRPAVRLHVRNRYDVASLVSWINGLSVAPQVICFGGTFGEPTITLTFRDASGAVLARATNGSCGSLALSVRGRKAVPLKIGDLLLRIEQRLHADLTPPRPREVSDCLRRSGWHVRKAADGLTVRKTGRPTTITFHATGQVTTTGPGDPAISRCLRSSPFIGYYK